MFLEGPLAVRIGIFDTIIDRESNTITIRKIFGEERKELTQKLTAVNIP